VCTRGSNWALLRGPSTSPLAAMKARGDLRRNSTCAAAGLGVILLVTVACTRHVREVQVPPEVGLKLYEERVYGTGPAPDSLRVYLSRDSYDVAKNRRPILEAQDAGTVCYEWKGSNELELRISGGYLDDVLSQWSGPDGRTVTVRYKGTDGCAWRRESPQ
jgi:hypothetical protein